MTNDEATTMNSEMLFRASLFVMEPYLGGIDRLEKEIATEHYRPRDFTMAAVFEFKILAEGYLNLARTNGIEYTAFNTSLARMEQRLSEFTARRDALLAQLGPEETQRRLLEEIEILVGGYADGVRSMMKVFQQMDAEEYEEFAQDDEFSDLETLTLRSSVHVLLPLLTESEAKAALELDLAQADAIMRRHGAELFGPLLRMGSIQQLREARFELRERWWWYLDEIGSE